MVTLALFRNADTDPVITREWAMASRWTFTIPPIAALLGRYLTDGVWLNPFAGRHVIGTVTNDLNPAIPTDYHLDALDFLRARSTREADGVLFDPPFSPRQAVESYRKFGRDLPPGLMNAGYWGALKQEIARVAKPGGTVITCGWNSGGIGQQRGFDMVEILLVAHGGWHNDTIVTVEKKRGAW